MRNEKKGNEHVARQIEVHGRWLRQGKGPRGDFQQVEVPGYDFQELDLNCGNFEKAGLAGAKFTGALVQGANFFGANLTGAVMAGASLRGADLRHANLQHADLTGADLTDAILQYALLADAHIEEALLPRFQIVPEAGAFVAYKKVEGSVILTLHIPDDALRTSALGSRKCRASKAKVLAAHTIGGVERTDRVFRSMYDAAFKYIIGRTVETDYSGDIRVECTHGIHFFMTKKEAREY